MADVTLVPYGNAKETKTSSGWTYDCQHGETECVYNAMETCGLSYISSTIKAWNFVDCIENNDDSRSKTNYDEVLDKCVASASIAKSQAATIKTCYTGSDGNALEHSMALMTEALSPAHTYVPWVVGQGVHSDEVQNEIGDSLLKYVCSNYTGKNKAAACGSSSFKSHMKDIMSPCMPGN